MKTVRYLIAAIAVLFAAAGANALVVRVEPVEVYNSPEVATLGGGLQSLIASRVADKTIEVRTTADPAMKPDWLIKTTITQLGGVFSVDASLVNAEGKAAGERAFETVNSSDKLMEALGKVSERLKKRLLAESSVVAPSFAPPAPIVSTAPEAGAQRRSEDLLSDYKVATDIQGEVLSLISVDADDDGDTELLALVRGNILALLKTKPLPAEAWRSKFESSFYAQYASAGDYDGDGKIEIFIAGNNGGDIYTQAYRLAEGGPKPVGERVWGFLRFAVHPEKGKILYGLPSRGGLEVFSQELYYYTWDGKKFARGERIPTPSGVPPLNVEWIHPSGAQTVHMALTDTGGHFRIYDSSLRKLYISDDPVKGGRVYFEGELKSDRTGEVVESWEINTPMAERGGLLFIYDNVEGERFTKKPSYENGKIVAMRWDGVTLRTIAESPKFSGYFTAITTGITDGRIYGALVKATGFLTKEYTTQIVSF